MSQNVEKILQDLSAALRSEQSPTRGIKDTASREQMIVSDSGVHIDKLRVEKLVGVVTGESAAFVTGDFNSLAVTGKIIADTLQVKNIISDQSAESFNKSVTFVAGEEHTLEGKGLLWHGEEQTRQFVLKPHSNSIFSTENLDLHRASKYKIDGVDILDYERLGTTVHYSNLRKVGVLDDLKVRGSAEIGDLFYLNAALGRLGLNTNQPKATLSIVDDQVEIVIGADNNGQAVIGTWTNHQLSFVTDNTNRITINGNIVEFGVNTNKSTVVKVHGRLEVDELVSGSNSDVESNKTFNTITVNESASFGNFVFVDHQAKRVGINNPNPTSALDIAERGVEISIGSNGGNKGYIGTRGAQGLDIIAHGKSKISISSKTINIGNVDDVVDVKVSGTLTVKNLINETAISTFPTSIEFSDVNNNGLVWNTNNGKKYIALNNSLSFIEVQGNVNLLGQSKILINNNEILSDVKLGDTVRSSNLTKVGVLETLAVSGSAQIANIVFVDSITKRLGINTDQPKSALSIKDNDTELLLGDNAGSAYISSSNGLNIITKNQTRISIKDNVTELGQVGSTDAILRVNGTLEVNTLTADTRIERSSSLEFLPDAVSGLYSKGLLWKGDGKSKQFIFVPGPDRFYSTENIDLSTNHSFNIGNKIVLSADTLGETVKYSSLTKLGILESLEVNGTVNLSNTISIENQTLVVKSLLNLRDGQGVLSISSSNINFDSGFSIGTQNASTFSADSEGNIVLGNRENTNKTVRIYGNVSVNVTNPDPSVALTVAGPISVDGKKQASGSAAPQSGHWNQGDIVWNSNPQEFGYVGWICLVSGTPGIWKPFGYIGEQ